MKIDWKKLAIAGIIGGVAVAGFWYLTKKGKVKVGVSKKKLEEELRKLELLAEGYII